MTENAGSINKTRGSEQYTIKIAVKIYQSMFPFSVAPKIMLQWRDYFVYLQTTESILFLIFDNAYEII